MKTQQFYLLCLILLFLKVNNCLAQDSADYLLSDDKIWSIKTRDYAAKKSYPHTRSHYIKIDSVGFFGIPDEETGWFRNTTEYKVYRSDNEDMSEWYEYGTIWEVDSIQKVYFTSRYESSFFYNSHLLYDFGAEKGDTLEVCGLSTLRGDMHYGMLPVINYVVDSIDTISIQGVDRKRIQLKYIPDNSDEYRTAVTWISGIGSLRGILYSAGEGVGQDSYDLLCVNQGDSLLYKNKTYPYCYYSTVDVQEIFAENVPIEIYPNPTNSILNIETAASDLYIIKITSLNGQQILTGEMEGTSHQIDLSSFQKGVYFITIRSKDFVTTKKIVKQ